MWTARFAFAHLEHMVSQLWQLARGTSSSSSSLSFSFSFIRERKERVTFFLNTPRGTKSRCFFPYPSYFFLPLLLFSPLSWDTCQVREAAFLLLYLLPLSSPVLHPFFQLPSPITNVSVTVKLIGVGKGKGDTCLVFFFFFFLLIFLLVLLVVKILTYSFCFSFLSNGNVFFPWVNLWTVLKFNGSFAFFPFLYFTEVKLTKQGFIFECFSSGCRLKHPGQE